MAPVESCRCDTCRSQLPTSTHVLRLQRERFSASLTLPPYPFFAIVSGEIAFLEGLTIVYKSSIDLFFYVVGSSHENEVSASLSPTPTRA